MTNKKVNYQGFINDAFNFACENGLLNSSLWARFVQQFREDADYDGGWRGEYWGKMMRGASLVYKYNRNPKLYTVLKNSVNDMINTADSFGRISSYAINHEFEHWDMWGRKYVLLGMQYFLEICEDRDFCESVIKSMCSQLDYIIGKIGNDKGKKEITMTTRNWRGLNSSSILEAVVRLYNITGEKRYFDFAKYIVDTGFIDVENIIELAYENKLFPYQYPVTKAYEMTSCFEGLIEFYKVTGEEKYKTALINYANKILESDFTIIGGCGCTHELLDHSSVRQANTTNGEVMQETCVTVTLMKFFYRMNALTGDPKYADAFETSLYNAYLGAFNTEKVIEPLIKREHPDWIAEPLPYDSYSPLTAGTRGNGIGGLKLMSDNHYYGCCACIGSAGIGIVPEMQLVKKENGVVLNLFINGTAEALTPKNNTVTLCTETDYPKCGNIKIRVELTKDEEFELSIRNPGWSKNTKLFVNSVSQKVSSGYIKLKRLWKNGDIVDLELDMRTEAIYPPVYEGQVLMSKVVWVHNYVVPVYDEQDPIAYRHIALRRGPLMLAQENRLGYSVDDAVDIKVNADGYVDAGLTQKEIPYKCIVKTQVPLTNGGYIILTDYASAGKLWTDESKMAVWMLTN